jgi:hypothetical protein
VRSVNSVDGWMDGRLDGVTVTGICMYTLTDPNACRFVDAWAGVLAMLSPLP